MPTFPVDLQNSRDEAPLRGEIIFSLEGNSPLIHLHTGTDSYTFTPRAIARLIAESQGLIIGVGEETK